jgi:hypothetical protein
MLEDSIDKLPQNVDIFFSLYKTTNAHNRIDCLGPVKYTSFYKIRPFHWSFSFFSATHW